MAVLIFSSLVFGGIVLTGFGRPSATALALFSDTYSVPVTDENRALLERYIRGSRSLRMVGVLIATGLLGLVMATTDDSTNATFYLGTGYGLGAVAYELGRRAPGSGAAALSTRRLDDYVNPLINRLLLAIVVVGVAAYSLTLGFEPQPDANASVQVDGFRALGAAAIGGLFVALVAGRRIIRGPQPVISPAIDAAQHAIRTAGLMSLVGLALMTGSILCLGGFQLQQSHAPSWLATVVVAAGAPLGIVGSLVGFFLAIRSLPRFAPFWRELPDVEPAASA